MCPSLNDYGPDDFATESLYENWRRDAIAKMEDELEKVNAEVLRLQRIEMWVRAFIDNPEIMDEMIKRLEELKPEKISDEKTTGDE